MEVNPVLKKRYGKKNLLGLFSSSSGKIDLILLIKVITFYMRLFMVYIQGTGFQGLISRLFGVCGSLSPQNSLKNPLQVLLSIFEDKECSGRDDNNKKIYH